MDRLLFWQKIGQELVVDRGFVHLCHLRGGYKRKQVSWEMEDGDAQSHIDLRNAFMTNLKLRGLQSLTPAEQARLATLALLYTGKLLNCYYSLLMRSMKLCITADQQAYHGLLLGTSSLNLLH